MTKFILVHTHPTEGEQRFELVTGRSYRIGSRPDNDIVIDQKDVSRRHAVLRVEDGSFHVTDLDSKNGTFVNGVRLTAGRGASLNSGDSVTFGTIQCRFEIDAPMTLTSSSFSPRVPTDPNPVAGCSYMLPGSGISTSSR